MTAFGWRKGGKEHDSVDAPRPIEKVLSVDSLPAEVSPPHPPNHVSIFKGQEMDLNSDSDDDNTAYEMPGSATFGEIEIELQEIEDATKFGSQKPHIGKAPKVFKIKEYRHPDDNLSSRARDHSANERTHEAWIRASLITITWGAGIARIGTSQILFSIIGIGCLVLGTSMVAYSTYRFFRNMRMMARAESKFHVETQGIVAAVGFIGVVLFALLIFQVLVWGGAV